MNQLDRIVKFAFDNVGRTFSAASISKYLKSKNRSIIQTAQEIGSPETEKREYGRLLDIRDNYPKYVLRRKTRIWDRMAAL